ncbi:MAG: ferritin-like domain-containing protein [Deltaproteobacteria bacterium]|nr:ferritin-like domain-containing protein [Deltaproteobacteria bacterium]MCW5802068.1 ferritin-like domain-containing protein [Deltaproteobacteria bacterium]
MNHRSHRSTGVQPGDNHTGVAMHPDFVAEMVEGATEFGPTSGGGAELIAEARVRAARRAPPVGTMPPSMPGADVPLERLPLLDKLGARLQFERTGVRLYEALLSKLEAFGGFDGGPSRDDLEQIRDDELRHFALAQQLVVNLGGDPTVVTPCANLQAVAVRGVCDVLVDPRATLVEGLEAILVAELVDRESWDHLAIQLGLAGDAAIEAKAREAERTEGDHLARVRTWLAAADRLVTRPLH